MKNTIIAVVITTSILVLTINVSGQGNYRPQYSFFDDVFKELPSFPEDFFEIKHLIETQQIMPHQLNSSYYLQPEILPNWNYCAEAYYNRTNDNIGQYGLSLYPSRFDIYNAEYTTIHLSAILYCNPGISKYQGAGISHSCDNENINVSISKDNVLLEPTYPYFHGNWSTTIKFTISIKEKTDATVNIMETEPDDYNNTLWKQQYGKEYVTGNSILSQRVPKLTIHLHNDIDECENNSNANNNDNNFIINIPITIIFWLFFFSIIRRAYVKIAKKGKNEI